MNNYLIIIWLYINTVSCQVSKDNLIGNDFRLFEDTPAWKLAKAVRNQDTSKFARILTDSKIDVDYEEPKYGRSVLQIAVLNNLDESVQKLLELGADPNHYSRAEGKTALHDAVGVFQHNDDTTVLSLLLLYGGDPNALTHPPVGADSENVLSVLCGNVDDQLKKLKLLVKAGASLEYDENDNSNFLNAAVLSQNYKLVYYLLNVGLNYQKPIFTNFSGINLSLEYCMKRQLIDLESEEYQYKLKVIDFLEKRGVDYRGVIPPKKTIEMAKRQYPDSWEEYLKVY